MNALELNPIYRDSGPVYEKIFEKDGDSSPDYASTFHLTTRMPGSAGKPGKQMTKKGEQTCKLCWLSFVFSVIVSGGVTATLIYFLCWLTPPPKVTLTSDGEANHVCASSPCGPQDACLPLSNGPLCLKLSQIPQLNEIIECIRNPNENASANCFSSVDKSRNLRPRIVDDNEYAERSCDVDNGGCEDRCENSSGNAICYCDTAGLTLSANNRTCRDIDECLDDPCDRGSTCLNMMGSFHCLTPPENQCADEPCAEGATCLRTIDGYYCLQSDVNECLEEICPEGSTCLNTYGSYHCLSPPGGQCHADSCPDGATCLETPAGGIHCLEQLTDHCADQPCTAGSVCLNTGNDHYCLPETADACSEEPCPDGETCINTGGDFICFKPQLSDVDECLNPAACSEGSTCVNTLGSYVCLDPPDVDECLDSSSCPAGTECLNTIGSFYCLETSNKSDSCLSSPCAAEQTCLNTENGYHCLEPPVEDIDECRSNPCRQGATCVNTFGSFICIDPPSTSGGGATFVRWGREECPDTEGMEEVYTGIMAGSHRTHHGGGSSYVCLAENPEWGNYTDNRRPSWRNYLYGAEYQLDGAGIFPFTASSRYLYSLNDQDVPCAVCRVSTRSSSVMVPARRSCPDAWTREYRGFLMTQKTGSQATGQYVCVDEAPTALRSGARNADGAALTFTASKCGAIRCPPFADYRELTCAVCTK